MTTKADTIASLIGTKRMPAKQSAESYAPANIALVKYWGKRNQELNLPVTDSLSLSLKDGTKTKITVSDKDTVSLNGKSLAQDDSFSKRLFSFIDLFREPGTYLSIETQNEIPTAAGFASSSSGFAAIILALNELYEWGLDKKALSILSRLGSGSASRSLYQGFVQWHKGTRDDGLDSFSEPLNAAFDDLSLGLVVLSDKKKPIDSRSAMRITSETSPLYSAWPHQVEKDMLLMKKALKDNDFHLLGKTAETNALAMHATMMASTPPIMYFLPESIETMHKVWKLRDEGLALYFTMDAGPNIKLLFLKKDAPIICQHFEIL